MNGSTFRKYIDVITTVLVVAFFLTMAGFYIHGKFFKKQIDPLGSTVPKDLSIADKLNVEYKTHSRTLILALDKDCVYCERSAGFYKRLIDLQATSAANTQLLAVLPNDEWDSKQYFRKQGLERLPHLSNVKLNQLQITSLPTLILVNRMGQVLESWSGELDNERQEQVVEAISNRTSSAQKPRGDLSPTFNLFDETKPAETFAADPNMLETIIEVDAGGYIYVQNSGHIEKRSLEGVVAEKIPVPTEIKRAAACSGSDGDFHFVLPQKIVTSRRNGKERVVQERPLPAQITPETASYDSKRKSIFILSDSTSPEKTTELVLYRFDLGNGAFTEIHRAQLPIAYNYAIRLGRMTYAIGGDKLFVADPTEYKIYVYSLDNNSLLTTFSQPFERPAIGPKDGKFESRNVEADDLSQGGRLKQYPAIFDLDYIGTKNLLLVWTSIRNSSHEQMIDIYDSELRPIGRDFRPTNPLISGYQFVGDRVIVPDYGFGKEFHFDFLSPLEPPYFKPNTIKTFPLLAAQRSS